MLEKLEDAALGVTRSNTSCSEEVSKEENLGRSISENSLNSVKIRNLEDIDNSQGEFDG